MTAESELLATLLDLVTGPLGTLLLEKQSDGSFRQVGPAPAWLQTATSAPVEEPVDAFPFLQSFLHEAETIWTENGSGYLRSGYWTQSAPAGSSTHLTARALRSHGRRLLAIACDEDTYRDHLRLAQRGRETTLALEQLDRETQKKEILFHCIVHDLGVPLNVLTGTLGLLEESSQALTPRAQELLHSALRATARGSALIREILDAFAAEREDLGRLEQDPARAPDVLKAVREAVELLGPEATRNDVVLRVVDLTPALDRRAAADPSRLQRVLANLIENAVRHSPARGEVTIEVAASEMGVEVAVQDQGPGVPPELRSRLFDKLVQGRGRSGRIGLGLYFCAITVRRWGGEIGYAPAAGGARFWFRLARPRASVPLRQADVDPR